MGNGFPNILLPPHLREKYGRKEFAYSGTVTHPEEETISVPIRSERSRSVSAPNGRVIEVDTASTFITLPMYWHVANLNQAGYIATEIVIEPRIIFDTIIFQPPLLGNFGYVAGINRSPSFITSIQGVSGQTYPTTLSNPQPFGDVLMPLGALAPIYVSVPRKRYIIRAIAFRFMGGAAGDEIAAVTFMNIGDTP